jgi:hypothetical protein
VLFHGSRYPSSIRRVVVPIGWNWSETRKALALHEAVAELRANAGTQFDPLVVDAVATISAE